MKDDERYFLKQIQNEIGRNGTTETNGIYHSVRTIINKKDFPIHKKRAYYLLQKWSDKDWYDYGVCLDLDWMEEKGMKIETNQ